MRIGPGRHLRAVVIGGGTGAPMSIRTLLSLGVETSAVVAMADDGGSTGVLREGNGRHPSRRYSQDAAGGVREGSE